MVYIFELNKKYDIDGSVEWNDAKWINHSCAPNCETEQDEEHIWIIAIKDIKRGEELNYDHCYDIDDYENHECKCGAKNCVGYIVHEKYKNSLRRENKGKRKSGRERRRSEKRIYIPNF